MAGSLWLCAAHRAHGWHPQHPGASLLLLTSQALNLSSHRQAGKPPQVAFQTLQCVTLEPGTAKHHVWHCLMLPSPCSATKTHRLKARALLAQQGVIRGRQCRQHGDTAPRQQPRMPSRAREGAGPALQGARYSHLRSLSGWRQLSKCENLRGPE